MNQLSIPLEIRPEEIAREHSLGDAIQLCAKLAGFALDKELQQRLDVDKAQFSRWTSGQEGIVWPKFARLMDACGNDAPLLWMLHQRGYDLASVRKRKSELEKKLEEAEQTIRRLEMEREVERRFARDIRVAA
jgi:plasmid maintenance system antidote protein VapI